jgi:hypothetical protein
VAGRPWSVTISLGASDGRALCARRCSQDRRQCARLARVKICSVGGGSGDSTEVSPLVKLTVSLRTTLSHARRMPQRGQSFHSTGARGNGTSPSVCVGGGAKYSEDIGQNTALTRRGLIVTLLS